MKQCKNYNQQNFIVYGENTLIFNIGPYDRKNKSSKNN